MKFSDWLKKIFNSEKREINIEEFAKDKLANEKWLYHYFLIPFPKSEKETNEEFIERANKMAEIIMSVVLGQLVASDKQDIDKRTFIYLGSLQKNVNIILINEGDNKFSFLVRFADTSVKDIKKSKNEGLLIRNIKPRPINSYLFSPLQSLTTTKILPNIEFGLVAILKIQPHENMTYLTFDSKKPIVTQFDGLQYFTYPIEKRAKLYKKYPKIDKLLFGMDFLDFIDWIMEKKNDNEHMKKYCQAVKVILKKMDI